MPDVKIKRKQQPERYSIWNMRDLTKSLIKELISHELAHAFDPAVIIPTLKHRGFKQPQYDKTVNKNVRYERYLLSNEEIVAQLKAGFKVLIDIMIRSVKLNYSNEIRKDVTEAINRIKQGSFDMRGLPAVAKIPFNLIYHLKLRKNKNYRTWSVKLINALNITLKFLDNIEKR